MSSILRQPTPRKMLRTHFGSIHHMCLSSFALCRSHNFARLIETPSNSYNTPNRKFRSVLEPFVVVPLQPQDSNHSVAIPKKRPVEIERKSKSEAESSAKTTDKRCSGCGTLIASGESFGSSFISKSEPSVGTNVPEKKSPMRSPFTNAILRSSQSFLCDRCVALENNDIWKSFDTIRAPKARTEHTVDPYADKIGAIVWVIDATNPDYELRVGNLESEVSHFPLILVINKIDLLPRLTVDDQQRIVNLVTSSDKKGMRFKSVYCVSARTEDGMDALARHFSELWRTRKNVVVVGAINAGKTSVVNKLAPLIAARQNKEWNFKSGIVSIFPGTTLHARRVPCYKSTTVALWDTPGIVNPRALNYSVFPSHLMSPLLRPEPIAVPTKENGFGHVMTVGKSVLIEPTWMKSSSDDNASEGTCVLARIDITSMTKKNRMITMAAYLHPSLKVRIVPTSEAPSVATIPPAYIAMVNQMISDASGNNAQTFQGDISLPLCAVASKTCLKVPGDRTANHSVDTPLGIRHQAEIAFPGLGWIHLSHPHCFSAIPYCVEGSTYEWRTKNCRLPPYSHHSMAEGGDVLQIMSGKLTRRTNSNKKKLDAQCANNKVSSGSVSTKEGDKEEKSEKEVLA